jgi:UDP-N-acetylmuramyl pentapeptide synthase
VPLIFFGQEMPSLWNVFAWLKIILQNEWQIFRKFPFDFVVIELGTDAPGQISQFRKYLHLDIAVVTAVAPEHMEFFGNIQNVAEEEWSVIYFSDLVFANRDLCAVLPEDFSHEKVIFYGKEFDAIFKYEAVSPVQLYSISIATIIAKQFKISEEKIIKAVSEIKSFSGRMQKLKGIKDSMIHITLAPVQSKWLLILYTHIQQLKELRF